MTHSPLQAKTVTATGVQLILAGPVLPPVTHKRAFVFSPYGDGKMHHNALKEKLANRGFVVVDEFCCKGWDTVGPLKIFGGINKGKPDENDLAKSSCTALPGLCCIRPKYETVSARARQTDVTSQYSQVYEKIKKSTLSSFSG